MNFEFACKILNIKQDNINVDIIKKQYRIHALKYHPDKNIDFDTKEKFHQIQESYEFLLKYHHITDINNNTSYNNILKSFVSNLFPINNHSEVLFNIIDNIIFSCEKNTLNYLNNLDVDLLQQIYKIIILYKDTLHINSDLIDKIKLLIKQKELNNEIIILNPNLNDLFNDNLYKLTLNNNTHIIPLWHHELIYDSNGNDITVKCNPILPNNITIDHNNNVIIKLVYNIREIWDLNIISYNIEDFSFSFDRNQLLLQKQQLITLPNMGISKININDVFNIDNKSNIILNISLNL
tara:strand:+ start:10098 stop:10979 length:882 start_codon:yes stop_codon:yes gene_type:complete